MIERKTRVDDVLRVGKEALEAVRKHCTRMQLNVRAVLPHFDSDGSGAIDLDELEMGLTHMQLDPPISRRACEGIFGVLKQLGKLDADGHIRLHDFAQAISLSDELGLHNAMKRHTKVSALDVQRLASTPAAFQAKSPVYVYMSICIYICIYIHTCIYR